VIRGPSNSVGLPVRVRNSTWAVNWGRRFREYHWAGISREHAWDPGCSVATGTPDRKSLDLIKLVW
jgi:hypothetical protein